MPMDRFEASKDDLFRKDGFLRLQRPTRRLPRYQCLAIPIFFLTILNIGSMPRLKLALEVIKSASMTHLKVFVRLGVASSTLAMPQLSMFRLTLNQIWLVIRQEARRLQPISAAWAIKLQHQCLARLREHAAVAIPSKVLKTVSKQRSGDFSIYNSVKEEPEAGFRWHLNGNHRKLHQHHG